MTYDEKSYELAEHFLQDEPCRDDPVLYKKHCDSLAKVIQRAVEDWFVTPDDNGQAPRPDLSHIF